MTVIFHKPKRLTAGLLHFCVSISVFLLILMVLINFWYPGDYFNASGGWQGIRIVASVDLVLGPLLTLVIFNPEKSVRELTTDISAIATVQLIALLWGIHTLYSQRPVAVVFWDKSFMTVPLQALADQGYALNKLDIFGAEHPPLIYADTPRKLEDLKVMLELINKEKIPPYQQPWLYRSLKDHFNDIRPLQLDIDKMVTGHPDVKNQLLPIMQKHNISDIHAMLYFLLQSKYSNSVLVFDQNAQYLGYVNPE